MSKIESNQSDLLVGVLSLFRALLDVGQVVRSHCVDERPQLLLFPRRVELGVDGAQVRLEYFQKNWQNVENQVGRRGEYPCSWRHLGYHAGQEVLRFGQLAGPLGVRVRVHDFCPAVCGEDEMRGHKGERHVRHQGVDLAAGDLLLRQVEEQHELVAF